MYHEVHAFGAVHLLCARKHSDNACAMKFTLFGAFHHSCDIKDLPHTHTYVTGLTATDYGRITGTVVVAKERDEAVMRWSGSGLNA